jgi:hypothetical protein
MTNTQITTKLDRIEDGFARVTNAETEKTIGYVSREKHGSGRTSVRWTATRTRTGSVVLGYGDTREEAVAVVAKNAARFAR